ncbi:hypothetical protein XENOCAPTIV_019716 [Xenoophorus captivus]|uniref:Uncharacterized protein n=1 Tax=Xenoophorus captivus TaxID=1517983 RepID=A0ABV0QJB7_9TELE
MCPSYLGPFRFQLLHRAGGCLTCWGLLGGLPLCWGVSVGPGLAGELAVGLGLQGRGWRRGWAEGARCPMSISVLLWSWYCNPLCIGGDLLLFWVYGCPGMMLYLWLPGTAMAFLSQVYLPLLLLGAEDCRRSITLATQLKLSGIKPTLSHTYLRQTYLFLHICSPTY